MNVDKFGHHVHKRLRLTELLDFNENALCKSETGDYDLKSTRLKGIRSPVEGDEVVNKDYVDRMNAHTVQEFNRLFSSLRSQIILDGQNAVKSYLKTKSSDVLIHFEDKFYTKAEVDNLIKNIPNGKTANSQ